jgi:gas vesicle protein
MNGKNGSRENGHHRAADIMISLSVGLVAGAASALLLAPASGRDTRQRIGRTAHRIADRANRILHRTGAELEQGARQVEQALTEGRPSAPRTMNLD